MYSRRWLKTFIPEKYAPLLNFDKFNIGRCRLFLYLVLYLRISLFVFYRCLLFTIYNINEYIYCEYIGSIFISLKSSQHESLGIVNTNFTCNLHMQFMFTDFWRDH